MKKRYFALFVCGAFALGAYAGSRPLQMPPFGKAYDLRRTYELIQSKHAVPGATDDALYYGAIRGMVESMNDPFSGFLDPKEAAKQREQMAGNFVGIGVQIGIKDEHLTVIAPMPDSPAAKAGLHAGDQIVTVDGQPTAGKTAEECVTRIRGEKGTTVTLNVRRDGVKDAFDVCIMRDTIDIPSVKWQMVTENGTPLMLVTVSSFHDDTAQLFTKAAAAAVMSGARGMILDLRNNPGGRVDAAGAIVCQWVTDRPYAILEPRDAPTAPQRCAQVGATPLLAHMPAVILVNGNSASASEITTGALQDFGKARVIGEQTYGKGCGQYGFDFPDGARLNLVTFLWKTPNGRSIHKVGITPDEVVKDDPEELEKGNDAQLDRAEQYLVNGR